VARKSWFMLVGWLFVLISSVSFSQGLWEQAGDTAISGGFGEGVVATDRYVYVVSQLRVNTEPRFFRLTPGNPSSEKELCTDGLPEGAFRNGTALAWDSDPNGYIYALMGARYPAQGDPNRRLFFRFRLDGAGRCWEALLDTPAAQGAGDALVYVEFEGKARLFAFLGSRSHETTIDGSQRKTVFAVYDIQSRSWEVLNLNPSWASKGTDDGASLVWDDFDRIYAFQGEVDEQSPRGKFAEYSLATQSWRDLSDNPEISQEQGDCGIGDGASLAYLGVNLPEQSDFIYALGGGCADESPGSKFYLYQISTDGWASLTDIPCPVGFYNGKRLFVFRDELYYWQGSPQTPEYVCGGDDVFRFTLP